MVFSAFVKLIAAYTLSVVTELAGDKLTNCKPITSIMLLSAVAIQAISLLLFLFMKVIVWGKYYLKVTLLTYLTYAQATEILIKDKWELEKVLA